MSGTPVQNSQCYNLIVAGLRMLLHLTLRSVYTLVWGFEPARLHTPTGAQLSTDAQLPWRGEWSKHSKGRPAETDMHKQHTHKNRPNVCTNKLAHAQTSWELAQKNKTVAAGYLHDATSYSTAHRCFTRNLYFKEVPCLFLPAEGSLGKAAKRAAFLKRGAENSRPGAALRSIRCLQGQRQSSRCHDIFHPHFNPRIYQNVSGGRSNTAPCMSLPWWL